MLVEPDLSFSKSSVSEVDAEVAKLQKAIATSTDELHVIRDKAKENLGEEEAQVFDAHLMILADPEFTGAVEQKVKDEKKSTAKLL